MKRIATLLVVSLSLLVGGCSRLALDEVLPDKRTKYRKSIAMPDLEVPPDLTLERDEDAMSIPGEQEESQSMSGFYAQRAEQAARSGRALDDEWVRLAATQSELWPRMKEYWTERGFTLELDDPELGILETEWREQESTGEGEDGEGEGEGDGGGQARQRHTFTIYAEPMPGENSIQVLVSSRSERWNGSDWQTLQESPYTEEMRREFRQYLSQQARRAPEPKATASEPEGDTPAPRAPVPKPGSETLAPRVPVPDQEDRPTSATALEPESEAL